MKKVFRLLLVLAALAVFVVIAGQKAVWASPPAPIDVPGDPVTGSGTYELGGCVTGSVLELKPGVKLNVAVLENWNSYVTDGLPPMPVYYWTLPGGPDDIFSCVVILKVMENDTMVTSFPAGKGSAEVCLETPLSNPGSIYYYDEFRLFGATPRWVFVGGPFTGGTKGCVPVKNSGVYAYYAPEPDKDLSDPSKYTTSVTYRRVGSVDVPSYTTTIAKSSDGLALGGCVTGNVKDLVEGNRLEAALVSSWSGVKLLPANIGKLYGCVVDLKFYKSDQMISELPKDDGNALMCFAIPPNKNGTLYFLDKYYDDKAEWVAVGGPYKSGITCGPVMKSGYYGMVDVAAK